MSDKNIELKGEGHIDDKGEVVMDKTEEVKPMTVNEKIDKLFGEVERLKQESAEKDETIQMLVETVDKARMATWDAGKPKKVIPIIKVSTIEGKIVTGWKMIKDIVKKNSDGTRTELQIEEFITEDGEKHPTNIYDVSTTVVKIPMHLTGDKILDEDSQERELTLKFDMSLIADPNIRALFLEREGKEFTINSKFAN